MTASHLFPTSPMSASPEPTPSRQLSDQQLVQEICSAPNALEAHRRFEKNAAALEEWQIIFAEESNAGSIKLLDRTLGPAGVATSVFRGKSLWLMDAPFVSQSGPMGFHGGSAMFVDSNAATYIRKIAYQDNPSPEALNRADLINQIGPRLQQLNPYLYLWEALRSWNDETVARCKESVAAIHALSSSGSKLTAEWGRRFRAEFRESAENFATGLMAEFERNLKAGLFAGLEDQLDLMEAILVRSQIIELSSNKAKEHKLAQLVEYMHEELSTIMLRELIVCGDILLRSNRSRISRKLNSIQNHADPLALIRNCAWDMYIPRALDALTSVTPDQAPHVDFYVAEVLSFDGDVSDIINTTKLRAIAVHRPSKKNFPFFDSDVAEWLGNRLGPKRMDALSDYFLPEAFMDRARRRPSTSVRSILEADREELMQLIRQKKG
ncbi:hypothetical protein CMPELA_20620 [Cupriavidus necator]|uniref:Uncharacterized protein n=1 Tax=Cupriavidus necator (strain ATCC 17699 / DSM 428 / KCTC 22496 / NCIMB 10442 / H16 / Stanier 337) TaxID=381666 RepID=Q0K4E6_CUPNH|nr:hypothetical protein [Cupriavidus necator]QCC03054.1 hypothetical protein E6A55_20770 [Cupriavidus necator H16]QQB80111.1 hypothetical protein I6H87_20370 [Cupriavidus necator]WKA44370.1 hypothetical protein QWP09_20810 [Cupriavidus necator]CAJ95128.1 conserved hypothetical protein [Cupriavidus necator H16]